MIGGGGESIQKMLSKYVLEVDCFERIETQAGVDVSYKGDTASAACVVVNEDGSVIEEKVWSGRVTFSYVPSFFALREFPSIYNVLKGTEYDLLFVHGHGRAHPRKFGLACHVGLYFQKPTIGVAGRKLVGDFARHFEKWTHLYFEGDCVGAVLKTHQKMSPIFASVGHKISLHSAVRLTFANVREHRFPEVLRLAHEASKRVE